MFTILMIIYSPIPFVLPTSVTYLSCSFFFFNDTATTEIYTLSLHDALPIYPDLQQVNGIGGRRIVFAVAHTRTRARSEEHTSELQSHSDLVCRLLLEKKKKKKIVTNLK